MALKYLNEFLDGFCCHFEACFRVRKNLDDKIVKWRAVFNFKASNILYDSLYVNISILLNLLS